MDLGINRCRGVHDAHRAGTRPVGLVPVAIPPAVPRHRWLYLWPTHPTLCAFREGSRHPRGHARCPTQGWTHSGACRGREDSGLGPHHRFRRFSWTRGADRSGRRLAWFNHCLVDAHARLSRRPARHMRVGSGYRGNLPRAARRCSIRPGSDPCRVHGRDLRLRRTVRRHFLHRGACPPG